MIYSDKLKDPRWQKKRLEILSRDDWTCQSCGNRRRTLHVHHILYNSNADPWDYKEIDLIVLCKICHEVWHFIYDKCDYDPLLISLVTDVYDKYYNRKVHELWDNE
ncbi:MAG: HNH endonuclease [Bacteroidetes bacterium]|nr:HNH endonuclease [Bacteroidota bacterium]